MKLKLLILVLALQSAWLLGTAAVQEHALGHRQNHPAGNRAH